MSEAETSYFYARTSENENERERERASESENVRSSESTCESENERARARTSEHSPTSHHADSPRSYHTVDCLRLSSPRRVYAPLVFRRVSSPRPASRGDHRARAGPSSHASSVSLASPHPTTPPGTVLGAPSPTRRVHPPSSERSRRVPPAQRRRTRLISIARRVEPPPPPAHPPSTPRSRRHRRHAPRDTHAPSRAPGPARTREVISDATTRGPSASVAYARHDIVVRGGHQHSRGDDLVDSHVRVFEETSLEVFRDARGVSRRRRSERPRGRGRSGRRGVRTRPGRARARWPSA